MLKLSLLVVAMFVVQALLSALQMKHFTREFMKLRKQGKVACGRKAGGFHAGAITMFLLDGDGRIREVRMLMGVTCFARVRPLPGFEGKSIATLTEADLPKHGKNLRRAILDARDTYNRVMAGEAVPEPLSPFQRAGRAFTSLGKG